MSSAFNKETYQTLTYGSYRIVELHKFGCQETLLTRGLLGIVSRQFLQGNPFVFEGFELGLASSWPPWIPLAPFNTN